MGLYMNEIMLFGVEVSTVYFRSALFIIGIIDSKKLCRW